MTNKRTPGKTLFALAMMIGLTNIFAATAQADEWHGHGWHDNGRHERYEHEWHHPHQEVYAIPSLSNVRTLSITIRSLRTIVLCIIHRP